MSRFVSTVIGRSLPRAAGILVNSRKPIPFPSSLGISKVQKYSAVASRLRKELPEFWILKIRSAFNWLDNDGDGYFTEKDFDSWTTEMRKLFPDMTEEQYKMLLSNISNVWDNFHGAKEKGPGYKVSEDAYIERLFWLVSQEGVEDMLKQYWGNTFDAMDSNQDGMISKVEHQRFFNAWKKDKDLVDASVAFAAIDADMDGMITRDEYVNAAIEHQLNFSDETKRSKHFFGPLIKD